MADEQYRMFVVWVLGEEELQTPPGVFPKRKSVFATNSQEAAQMGAREWALPIEAIGVSIV